MKALLLLCALTLTGCATRVPKTVLVPVTVPCKVDLPSKPVWATSALAKDADIFDQVKALLAERRQRAGYQKQLEAAIAGCNTPTTAVASK